MKLPPLFQLVRPAVAGTRVPPPAPAPDPEGGPWHEVTPDGRVCKRGAADPEE